LPQTLVVLVLLVATAVAFAVTERLKLERSPITGTHVDKVFSPVCECTHDVSVISFRLRRRETVTVDMLDSSGHSVQTLVRDRHEAKGPVSYTWDGRDRAGQVVPEGLYRPRVRLAAHGRTIVLPNPIRVDTTPPAIRLVRVVPRVFSPDGDRRRDHVSARYKVDEPARAIMLVDGTRRGLGRFRRHGGKLVWYGKIHGRPARPGTYEIELLAIDRAGNRSGATRRVPVRIRYIELARRRLVTTTGRRFKIGVSTDAVSYRWVFAGKKGASHRRVLRLAAPGTAGRYTLYVTEGRYADKAEIVVKQGS
jgi:hypothetical protein